MAVSSHSWIEKRPPQPSPDTSLTDKHLVCAPLHPTPSLLIIIYQPAENQHISQRKKGKSNPQICQDNCASDKSPMENPSNSSFLP